MTIVILPITPPFWYTLCNLMGIGPERDAYPSFASHRARLVEFVCNFRHTSIDAWTTKNLKHLIGFARMIWIKSYCLPRADSNLDRSSVIPRRTQPISCPLLFCHSTRSLLYRHRYRRVCCTSRQLILFSILVLLCADSSLPLYLHYCSANWNAWKMCWSTETRTCLII